MITNKNVYVIAEAGVNHNGSLDNAVKLIDTAALIGANAIKFQMFNPNQMVVHSLSNAEYQKKKQKYRTQYEMLESLSINTKCFYTLQKHAKEKKIDFLCTPFDRESLFFLTHNLKINTLKISSGDITNAPLLIDAGFNAKNVILSTGGSNINEINNALGSLLYGFLKLNEKPSLNLFNSLLRLKKCKKILQSKVTLLHCTSEYPAPFDEVNLMAMKEIKNKFNTKIGYSDHTTGILTPLGAICFGAKVIEKHFTLNKYDDGPDHKASLEPDEFKKMIQSIRLLEKTFGNGHKKISKSEKKNINLIRKNIVAKKTIYKGDIFTEKNLTVKRAGKGITPFKIWDLLDSKSKNNYRKDDIIKIDEL